MACESAGVTTVNSAESGAEHLASEGETPRLPTPAAEGAHALGQMDGVAQPGRVGGEVAKLTPRRGPPWGAAGTAAAATPGASAARTATAVLLMGMSAPGSRAASVPGRPARGGQVCDPPAIVRHLGPRSAGSGRSGREARLAG